MSSVHTTCLARVGCTDGLYSSPHLVAKYGPSTAPSLGGPRSRGPAPCSTKYIYARASSLSNLREFILCPSVPGVTTTVCAPEGFGPGGVLGVGFGPAGGRGVGFAAAAAAAGGLGAAGGAAANLA